MSTPSKKKVLLKVIILGDSGFVPEFRFCDGVVNGVCFLFSVSARLP